MKSFRSYVLDQAERLQRKSITTTLATLSAAKGNKKKDRPSVTDIALGEDIRVSHDTLPLMVNNLANQPQEEAEILSDILSVASDVPVLFPVSECEELLKMTIKDIERTLQEKFELAVETNLRDAILLDYYVAAVYWAQQQNYTATKLFDFTTIVHAMIHKITEDHASIVELIKELQTLLSGTSKESKSPDKSPQLFSKEEKKAVAGYFYSSLFQHLKLYHYVFSRGQAEEIIENELSVELPLSAETPWPPALYEGMPETIVTEYLLLSTPPSEAEIIETPRTPSDVEMPSEIMDVFAKLTLQDVKNIIHETSTAVLSNLQTDFENKMKTHQATVLSRINKVRGETSNTAVI